MSIDESTTQQGMPSIGLIGAGRWGTKLATIFNSLGALSAFTTRGNEKNIGDFQQAFPNIRYCSSVEELLSDPTMNAVVIATPIATHYEIAKSALEHGKHVFVEKPTALHENEVDELVALATKNNKVLFSGYRFLYSPSYINVKTLIANEGAQLLSFSWNKWGTFTDSGISNLLCHDIAMVIDLVGALHDEKILLRTDVVGHDDLITAQAQSNTANVIFSINRVSQDFFKEVLIKTKDSTYVWDTQSLQQVGNDGHLPVQTITEKPNELELECRNFLSHVSDNHFWIHQNGTIDKGVAHFFDTIGL